jgi:hypothetical protein
VNDREFDFDELETYSTRTVIGGFLSMRDGPPVARRRLCAQIESEEIEKEDSIDEQQQCYRAVHDESLAAAVVVPDKEVGKEKRECENDDSPQKRMKIAPRLARRWDLQALPEFRQALNAPLFWSMPLRVLGPQCALEHIFR